MTSVDHNGWNPARRNGTDPRSSPTSCSGAAGSPLGPRGSVAGAVDLALWGGGVGCAARGTEEMKGRITMLTLALLGLDCSADFTTAPSCGDGRKNGSEGGQDCGNGCPNKCALGSACTADGDCIQGLCRGEPRVCTLCGDGTQNGNESDLDCGGGCAGCDVGQLCRTERDCLSGACLSGFCGPAGCVFTNCGCADQVANPGDVPRCEEYLACYLTEACPPDNLCRGPDGVCGVNRIGGGAAPQAAADAVWQCACGGVPEPAGP